MNGLAQATCPGDFAIAIDIGHSRTQPGAISTRGKPVYDFNRRLGFALYKALRAQGYRRAYLLDPKGALAGADGLHRRTERANARPTDLLISLHHDPVQAIYLQSWQLMERSTSTATASAATACSMMTPAPGHDPACTSRSCSARPYAGKACGPVGIMPSRSQARIAGENRSLIDPELGIYAADFWMLRQTQAPAVLLAAGVIINREEELQLEQAAYRERIIQALLEAIADFCACQDQDDTQVDAGYSRR